MSYRITGLSPQPFQDLFGLDGEALRERGAIRYVADREAQFPDRIELRDAEIGESVLLVNYTHQPAATPYRASHAIYVLEGAQRAYDRRDKVPGVLRRRVLSLRAFDTGHMMVDGDVVEGAALEAAVERMFENADVAYLQAHYAKRGCYAARIDRA
jgi:hypothetical protein